MNSLRTSRTTPPVRMPDGVTLISDVVYGMGSGRELLLDLYLPEETGILRPGILFLHGGGWRAGGRIQFRRQAVHMATKGFVGASVEYRLSGEALFPAAVEDAKCVVRWMRAHSTTYHIDASRIAAVGGSAGGHLAALLGTTDASSGLEGEGGYQDCSSSVNTVVAFNGVFDMASLGKSRLRRTADIIAEFMGGYYTGMPAAYALASPITHVDGAAAPCLLLHGTADQAVPFEQSVVFRDKLKEAGVDAELVPYEGAPHGFFNQLPHFESALQHMEGFLVGQLGS